MGGYINKNFTQNALYCMHTTVCSIVIAVFRNMECK